MGMEVVVEGWQGSRVVYMRVGGEAVEEMPPPSHQVRSHVLIPPAPLLHAGQSRCQRR